MINLFFDCEFTHLPESAELPVLVSIGVVSDDGKKFYAENADVQEELYSEFVIEVVLPLLEGGDALMPYADIAKTLKAYIESFEDDVKMWTDSPAYDWPHVHHMFETYGWPKNLKRTPVALSFTSPVHTMRFLNAVDNIFRSNKQLRIHHALDDAIANRYAFQAVTKWRY